MHNVSSPIVHESDSVAEQCAACGHPASLHDVIGARWCAATLLGVGARACICSEIVAPARQLTHY